MRRYALRDDQWDRIKDILPGREGHVGVTAKDNRLFVEAVIYRYRAGIPWRDLPERFGDPIKIHTRFSRWAKSGVWKRLFEMLACSPNTTGSLPKEPNWTSCEIIMSTSRSGLPMRRLRFHAARRRSRALMNAKNN